MKIKVLIVVSGGCVIDVMTDNPDVVATLLDIDNLREEHGRDEIDKIVDEKMEEYPYTVPV